MDAPESRQTCADGWPAGRMATAHLAGLMRGRTTTCEYQSKDRYGRSVGVCKADGEDVGEAMVRRGMAFAYLQYSWRYLPQNWLAWYDGVGMHGHDCEKPWEWRARVLRGH
ncbi:MAG: thermonuclease family protein [Reyranella sp.]|nr:thermonuclease family protein [Reyranella sp.]MDP1961507.1 thermonuclease family protein [Reyranella sp.]MDP2376788.1 thermonuclease family protein [Reyranella sp.]